MVGGVLEPSEPSSRQLRLSVRPLEPRASYLAGWEFTMRDRAIKDLIEKCEKSPNWGSGAIWHESCCWIAAIYREDKNLLLIQVNLVHMSKDQHVTSRSNRRLICTQQYTKNKGYLLRKGC